MNIVKPIGFESVAVTNTVAIGLTKATYGAASRAVITIESDDCRVRIDGVAPTLLVGHAFQSGNTMELMSSYEISMFKAIALNSAASLQITYFE